MPLQTPPTPPWEGLHPLVVHFPIALLLFAAVFVVLAAIVPKRGWWFSVSALILLIGGSVGASVAISTGEAARDIVEDGEADMFDVLQDHEDMARQAYTTFVVLTGVYALIVVLPLVARPLQGVSFALPANVLFLVALMFGNLIMANAAHLGGRLVHQYGVLSPIAGEGTPTSADDPQDEAEWEAEAEVEAEEEEAAAPPVEMEEPVPETEDEAPAPTVEPEAPPAKPEDQPAPLAEPESKETPSTEPETQETPPPEPEMKEAPTAEPAKETPDAAPADDSAASEPAVT